MESTPSTAHAVGYAMSKGTTTTELPRRYCILRGAGVWSLRIVRTNVQADAKAQHIYMAAPVLLGP